MNEKEYLTNRAFCPIPWTGFVYYPNGDISNDCRSDVVLGNVKENSIEEILHNNKNVQIKQQMLDQKPVKECHHCYYKEENKKSFDIVSDRIFFLKELSDTEMSLYDSPENFKLRKIDVRWTNVCNLACVYCAPGCSSKWATELNEYPKLPSKDTVEATKKYIFDNIKELKHIYLSGGEPMLMKENLELLNLLFEHNPEVNIRVNTNLSVVDNLIFDTICKFKNVQWIISIEAIEQKFEYIRYGANWQDFVTNLQKIKQLNHKISFNMIYFLLSHKSIFECLDFLQQQGFHNNSFVVTSLITPDYLNIRNLPKDMLQLVQRDLESYIDSKPNFLLEDGLRNVLKYTLQGSTGNFKDSLSKIQEMDKRRNLNCRAVFTELYNLIERQ